MKKLLIIFFILIFSLTACSNAKSESESVSKSQADEIYVYITETGDCYHTSGCYCLKKSKIKITLSEATKKYRECHICYPPIIE